MLKDLRFAARALWRRPAFTLAAVAALAIGIGANTAIFSVVEKLLLRPLPYPAAEQLVMVYLDNQVQGWPQDLTSYPNYLAWKEGAETLADLAPFTRGGFSLTGGGDPERLTGARVGGNFFSLLGTAPLHGRVIGPAEDQEGKDQVAVLSHQLFQLRFGGEPEIVGQEIELDGARHTVIGIMPPGFTFPRGVKDFGPQVQLWVPLAAGEGMRESRGSLWLWTVGRLQPRASLAQAAAELGTIANRLVAEFPDSNTGMGTTLVGLHDHLVGKVRRGLLLLMGAVGFVLVITIANVASLLLARASDREREIAVRTAMGAGRLRIARQLMTESLLLAVVGGLAGVALAFAVLRGVLALAPPELLLESIAVSWTALWFTLVVSLVSGLLFGMAPVLQMSRSRFGSSLRDGGRGMAMSGLRVRGARAVLVAAELALATVLLVGAGLMIRSLSRLGSAEVGFDQESLLSFRLSLPRSSYGESVDVRNFYRDLLERLRGLPGVASASATTGVLLADFPRSTTFSIEGRPPPEAEERVEVTIDAVMPGYFEALGVPVLSGREFDGSERLEDNTQLLINREFSRRFFADQDPVGQRITYGQPREGEETDWMTIVGVVADTRRNGLEKEIRPETYLPHEQFRSRAMMVLLRTDLEPNGLAQAAREVVWSLDDTLPVSDVSTVDAKLEELQGDRRFLTRLLALFAGVALVLAATGIYGLMTFLVTQGLPELGVRMALGAGRLQVLAHVLGRGALIAAVGVAVGTIAALGLTRLLESQLYEVSAADPVVFVGLAATLLAIAVLACALPARRASRVDPVIALRHD